MCFVFQAVMLILCQQSVSQVFQNAFSKITCMTYETQTHIWIIFMRPFVYFLDSFKRCRVQNLTFLIIIIKITKTKGTTFLSFKLYYETSLDIFVFVS